jgi:SnoaL-like domain
MLAPTDAISNLVARYVRNVDSQNHAAQAELFSDDAVVRVLADTGEGEALLHGPIVGGAAVAKASAALRAQRPPGRRSRHCTTDRLVSIDRENATVEAQFVVFRTERLSSGEVHSIAIETGEYRFRFRHGEGAWLICGFDVVIDAPALPAAMIASR